MSPKPPSGSNVLERYVFRGVLALAGASMGVNSYLVKEKVGDISADIKSMSHSIANLEINNAVADQKLNALGVRVDQTQARLDRLQERLQSLEVAMSKAATKLSIPFGSADK